MIDGRYLVERSAHKSATEARLITHVQQHAGRYYPELVSDHVCVRLASHTTNPNSRSDAYEFCLSTESVERRIIAKVQLPWKAATRGEGPFAEVSRLLGPAEPRVRSQHEFAAMSSLMVLVDGETGERFGSVRMFEMLAEPHAIIMEKRPEEDCRQLLALAGTGSGAASLQILSAMRNTGALLRRFHRLPNLPHTKARCADVGKLTDSLLRLTQYLRERVRQGPFLERISGELVKRLQTDRLDGLPLGLSHGDLLPGNVLVGRHGRAVLLDTLAEWRAPVYEDLGQFIAGLRLFMLRQMPVRFDATSRLVERWEQEFLASYFADEPIPLGWIRIFECQFLLERWAWLVHEALETQGFRRVAKACRLNVWLWFAQRLLDRLLQEADRHGIRGKTH